MKIYTLYILILLSVLLSSCSEQMKAEKSIKRFLVENSNDGKVEIVKCGELSDYIFVIDKISAIDTLIDSLADERDECAREMLIFPSWCGMYKTLQSDRDNYAKQVDSLVKVKATTKNEKYPIKIMQVAYRCSNEYGAIIKQDTNLYLSNDLDVVSGKPIDVIAKLP